jgi:hypothetical protein
MRLEMLSFLNTLRSGIIALEVVAEELVRAAEASPDEAAADIMLTVACGHRVKILEMQGQFAALKKFYSERYHREA